MPLILTLGLAWGLVFLGALSLSGGPAEAQGPCDRWVLAFDGSDSSDCSDEIYPCETVQYAIDQAADGDVICVADHILAPGPTIYNELLTITRSLTLDGKWAAACVDPSDLKCSFTPITCTPERVVLDALGAGRVIGISGNIAPTIDCFTITGGDAAGLGGDPDGNDAGGGIYSVDAAPIIVNSVITDNYGCDFCPVAYGRGGGIYLLSAPSTAIISGNLVAHNVADDSTWGQGGGIMLWKSDAQVYHNRIEYNRAGLSAGYGGGIAVREGTPTIADNEILHNVAGQSVQGLGGGIFVWSSMPATIKGNHVESNQAINGVGDPTLISRGGGIYYAGDPTTTAAIHDNTIRYNVASPLSPVGYGGGIYLSGLVSPSLVSDNTLEGNIAGHNDDGYGGGLYVDDSEVTLSDNNLLDNAATWSGSHGEGGGVYANGGSLVLQGNAITRNRGAYSPGFPSTATGFGGGIAVSGTLTTITDNWIEGNRATNGDGEGLGGGIYGFRGSLHIEGNTIAENRVTPADWGSGGGLYLLEAPTTLEANTIVSNRAADGVHGRGGGVRISFCPAFTLTNNIVARNSASELGSGVAIAGNSTGELYHNTIAENLLGDGVGVHVTSNSDVAMVSNIVVSHTVGITNADLLGSTVAAKYTLFEGNLLNYGPGVDSDYEIAGPAALLADYHLDSTSGAVDQAPFLAWVTGDIDGDPRPIGAAPDVGADERRLHLYLPLVLRDGP
jgi:hypothetical protein